MFVCSSSLDFANNTQTLLGGLLKSCFLGRSFIVVSLWLVATSTLRLPLVLEWPVIERTLYDVA